MKNLIGVSDQIIQEYKDAFHNFQNALIDAEKIGDEILKKGTGSIKQIKDQVNRAQQQYVYIRVLVKREKAKYNLLKLITKHSPDDFNEGNFSFLFPTADSYCTQVYKQLSPIDFNDRSLINRAKKTLPQDPRLDHIQTMVTEVFKNIQKMGWKKYVEETLYQYKAEMMAVSDYRPGNYRFIQHPVLRELLPLAYEISNCKINWIELLKKYVRHIGPFISATDELVYYANEL